MLKMVVLATLNWPKIRFFFSTLEANDLKLQDGAFKFWYIFCLIGKINVLTTRYFNFSVWRDHNHLKL